MKKETSLDRDIIAFALGTGRCGTHFLNHVMDLEADVASWHERHPMSDSFHRYCKWYGLKVDHAGFIETKKTGVAEDFKDNICSFEASAYLSFSIAELYDSFSPKFIHLVRAPDKIVNSFTQKGWYRDIPVRSDCNLPVGYQVNPASKHHPFSRIFPVGDEAHKWNSYTQVGRLAWFWKVVNKKIIDDLKNIPKRNKFIIKIEDLDFNKYKEIIEYLQLNSSISEKQYEALVNAKPGTLYPGRSVHDWSEKEIREFETEVRELAMHFGYEWRVDSIKKQTEPIPTHRNVPFQLRSKLLLKNFISLILNRK